MSSLVSKLKPWVTFSAAIEINCKHGDELCVGGKVTSIFDMAKFLKDEDKDAVVQIELDDSVGITSLMLFKDAYDKYNEKYNIKENDIILAKGKLFDPENFLKSNKDIDKTPRIMCWEIKPLEKEE